MQADGKTFKPGVTSRVINSIAEGLDVVTTLTDDRQANLQNLETRIIHLEALSTNDPELNASCRFRAWTWNQRSEATTWIENEINLSNARMAAARALREQANFDRA
eukprot:Blabericola_migrator_1__9268@NODE_4987_length_913_cov_3_275414_g3138_i0_p2_GENE_NODE_4987_length_913_cov_3_275414_g3138_i0NODE_4987_length_913_cov_3_275414_g3138_i0_p2_ORF_typecomplete_len106_score7_37_NODE_4987_length_913_cov_3_275414_g3138_i0541858